MICKMLHKYSNCKHKLFFSRLLMEVYAHNKPIHFLAHKWPVLVSLWMAWYRINLRVGGTQNQAVASLARQCNFSHCTQQQRTISSDDNDSQSALHLSAQRMSSQEEQNQCISQPILLQHTGLLDAFQLKPGCIFPNEVNRRHWWKSPC